MSYLLRHGANAAGLQIKSDGFVFVDDLLKTQQLQALGCTEDVISRIVNSNDKQRFCLETDVETGKLKVRANQGHTIKVPELELVPITSALDYPVVVHGTYRTAWEKIKTEGLSRRQRTHIHFARGEPGEDGVISGMRASCDILIFVDLEKALADNVQFFVSANNVILCPGDSNGFLAPKYFREVYTRKPRKRIL